MSKVMNLLGLAQRAGKVVSGDFIVEKALKSKSVKLLLLAADAGPNNEKKYRHLADVHHVPLRIVANKDSLGHAIGKELRVVIAIQDQGFSQSMIDMIDKED